MRVLSVKPFEKPAIIDIEDKLEKLQEYVGGYIEATYPFEDTVAMILNGEAKLNGSMPNRAMRNNKGDIYDIYFGNFLIVGINETNFCSLTKEQISKYEKLFFMPEIFVQHKGKILALSAG